MKERINKQILKYLEMLEVEADDFGDRWLQQT